jgi:hypothetical protein
MNESTENTPTALLPVKPQAPFGKRSTPGWEQKSVLVKEESVRRANEKLRHRGDCTDFPTSCRLCWISGLMPPNEAISRARTVKYSYKAAYNRNVFHKRRDCKTPGFSIP